MDSLFLGLLIQANIPLIIFKCNLHNPTRTLYGIFITTKIFFHMRKHFLVHCSKCHYECAQYKTKYIAVFKEHSHSDNSVFYIIADGYYSNVKQFWLTHPFNHNNIFYVVEKHCYLQYKFKALKKILNKFRQSHNLYQNDNQ